MAIKVYTTVKEIHSLTARKAGHGGIFKFGGFLYMAVSARTDVFEIASLNNDCSEYIFYRTPKLKKLDSDICVEIVELIT